MVGVLGLVLCSICVSSWFLSWFGALSILSKVTFQVVKSGCSAGYECDYKVAGMPECVFSEVVVMSVVFCSRRLPYTGIVCD